MTNDQETGIAIIGMSGRFPGAPTIQAFWNNLCSGVESIAFFSDEEMLAAGVNAATLADPRLVKAGGVIENIDLFDAHFFGYSPREIELIDPQQRIFLECAWEALEVSGYISERYGGTIGVFGSVGHSDYLLHATASHDGESREIEGFQARLGSEGDFVATRASYKLNLTGPSLTVQTACSSSLVATHLACQSLLNGECDIALAGGVSINPFQKNGYLYQDGGILSPDGHCRAFDARARGTVPGWGAGVVVLKPLADALADGDTIYAVIKGSAINNDGAQKVGFTAPSTEGQARVIAEALAIADFAPETIGYVECHGTGTELGDPIEVKSLIKAFRSSSQATAQMTASCALGSVKTNIGHLDTAAGIAGLIKTALILKHKVIPPSLHFEQPNPQIDFAHSPFYVNTTTSPWEADQYPRRAGVNSFGIGGTNAHIVLEEAPVIPRPGLSQPWQLIVLSAKTHTALDTATANLVEYATQHSDVSLADVAYTLQNGRRVFKHRRILVCRDLKDISDSLGEIGASRMLTSFGDMRDTSPVFLFPGQGSQYINMGKELYQTEAVFRTYIDQSSEYLKPLLGADLRDVIYCHKTTDEESVERLNQTYITQPALFITEYALAQLWIAWGIEPRAMIGHSIGEYVAACLAGVFSLEDALTLVAMRGKFMQQLPPGAMLAVPLPYQEIAPFLKDQLSLAAVNHPHSCVVSGTFEAVNDFQNHLAEQGVTGIYLHTSHAFHSGMMEPILAPFGKQFKDMRLNAPKIPYISNVTATWITEQEATDPDYWVRHLREPVYFGAGVSVLLQQPDQILLEVGPGQTLTRIVKHISERRAALMREDKETSTQSILPGAVAFSSLGQARELRSERASLLLTLGKLWLAGMNIDWARLYGHEQRSRIPLPTYPFERQRYWFTSSSKHVSSTASPDAQSRGKNRDIDEWFYIPSWKRSLPPGRLQLGEIARQKMCWMIFTDQHGLGASIVRRLRREEQDVISVVIGDAYRKLDAHTYVLDPRSGDNYDFLLKELCVDNKQPQIILHLWSIHPPRRIERKTHHVEKALDEGYYSIIYLVQALEKNGMIGRYEHVLERSLQIEVISNNMYEFADSGMIYPEKATITGPCIVAQQEHPDIRCHCIDIPFPSSKILQEEKLVDQLLAEVFSCSRDLFITYRGKQRWLRTFEHEKFREHREPIRQLRKGGVYLITGGLGDIGLLLADTLAQRFQAKLVLLGRTGLPPKSTWGTWLADHDDLDEVSRKIRRVQALEARGSEVLLIQADVSNEGQMWGAMAQIDKKFGTLHGVIHTAGIAKGASLSSPINVIERAISETQFQPKIYGLYILEKVLRKRTLDFVVLLSSNAAILGGLGLVAYTTANLFMDAFAHQLGETSETPWISTNWDGWLMDGQEKKKSSRYLMTPEESTTAFMQVVSYATLAQVIISMEELFPRLGVWVKREELPDKGSATEGQFYTRPDLWNAYVPVRNEVEQQIAGIWQHVLGIEKIGVHDNFFDLGGHSLLASQAIRQLRDAFQVEIPLRVLFEASTIEQLAQFISAKQNQVTDTLESKKK